MDIIKKYFPDLTEDQIYKLKQLKPLYEEWNSKINVISRKDISHLYERHVLHSLSIGKVIRFKPETRILDVGTGGGFPGIPLAILFPECSFLLNDSIQKKIRVVDAVCEAINLKNVDTFHGRVQEVNGRFDFVISRAVTAMPRFVSWVRKRVSDNDFNDLPNGILYLKGGDLTDELTGLKNVQVFDLSTYFEEPFFDLKTLHSNPNKAIPVEPLLKCLP